MQKPVRFGFFFTTHILVAVLAALIGFKLGTGATFQQMIGMARNERLPELVRLQNTEAPVNREDVDFSLFWEVWNRLERDYLVTEKIDGQQMVYGAIAGMTSALGDPYTVFLPPANKQRLTEDLQGEFDGVGIELGYKENQLSVISPLKDHPAEKAGVKSGDWILRIADKEKGIDKDATGMTAEEAVTLIRGKKGTLVSLTILTQGQEPRTVDLMRDTIEIPSVELYTAEQDGKVVAHIVLSRFGDKTMAEWDSIVRQIQTNKEFDGIVLDMRGNPGGYLQDAIDIASDFIDGGVVVSQQGRTGIQPYQTTRSARLKNTKVVILVNKGSASASEILAGALRDRRQAKLLGEQTYGKGTVQDAQDLPGGAGLNITIARWLLPSGESIQDTGLPVTIEVTDDPNTETDEVLTRAVQEL